MPGSARREGWHVNQKPIRRIYNELGLQLRKKTPKRRVKATLREDRAPATRPNDVWAMDFVHDQLATGRKIRVLTVVDTFGVSRRRSIRASAIAPRTSSPRWKASARNLATRSRSGSIKAPGSLAATSVQDAPSEWTVLTASSSRP